MMMLHQNVLHAPGWRFRRSAALACAVLALLALPAAAFAESPATNQPLSCEWFTRLQTQLERMGLPTQPSNTSRSVVLGLVRGVDEQARLLDAEQIAALTARREGLVYRAGVQLGMSNGLPVLRDVPTNSPAATAGLTPGDVLTGIGDQPLTRIALPDAVARLRSDRPITTAVQFVRADLTNTVRVAFDLQQEPALELTETLPGDISYIKINGLYRDSSRELVSRLRAGLEAKRAGIIIDLRGAGGTDTEAAGRLVGQFCPTGQFLFAFRDLRQQDLLVVKAAEHPADVVPPVMVLVDRETSGAAEVLAAALHGALRSALLIGETTAGDFTLREVLEVSGEPILAATKVLDTADGARYTGRSGITPSVPVTATERNTGDYEPPADPLDRRVRLDIEEQDLAKRRRLRGDPDLERAVDIITGLKSLNKPAAAVSSTDSL